jgi:hypothetical protein
MNYEKTCAAAIEETLSSLSLDISDYNTNAVQKISLDLPVFLSTSAE